MTVAYKNARLCNNNFLAPSTMTTSTSQASFPSANLFDIRSKVWKPLGSFEITAANQKVYINGSTFDIPVGAYNVTTLITAFNTATSQTLARNSLGRFVITLGSSGTVNFATTTNAIWDTLGFFRVANETGTTFQADERRYNNGEWLKADLGFPQRVDFASLLAPSGDVFSAPTAEVRLQGNNVDDWAAPPVNLVCETTGEGVFIAPQEEVLACRYWRILIKDFKNNSISIAVAYMGSAAITLNTNVATGLSRVRSDQSVKLFSEAGQLYVDRRPRRLSLTSMQIQFLRQEELLEIEQLMYDLRTGVPFFICLDPSKNVSQYLHQMTHYVNVEGDATFQHVIASYYNLSFQLVEVL